MKADCKWEPAGIANVDNSAAFMRGFNWTRRVRILTGIYHVCEVQDRTGSMQTCGVHYAAATAALSSFVRHRPEYRLRKVSSNASFSAALQ